MKQTVKSLVTKLTSLQAEEQQLKERLKANQHEQDEIMSSLQVKPPAAAKRKPATTSAGRAAASPPSTTTTVVSAKSAAARVSEHVMAVPDGALITTDGVATKLAIKSSTVSTALSRLVDKLIEREPGAKRGKFRKIKKAA